MQMNNLTDEQRRILEELVRRLGNQKPESETPR
jgi:hypothetical protein